MACSGAWRGSGEVGAATSSGLGRGQGGPPASWSRPSAEGVKASQHVWLLMIATPQGPGEDSREAFCRLLSVTGVRAEGPQSAPVSEWLAVCPLSVGLSVWVAPGQVRAHSDAPVSFLQLEPAFVAAGHKPPAWGQISVSCLFISREPPGLG